MDVECAPPVECMPVGLPQRSLHTGKTSESSPGLETADPTHVLPSFLPICYDAIMHIDAAKDCVHGGGDVPKSLDCSDCNGTEMTALCFRCGRGWCDTCEPAAPSKQHLYELITIKGRTPWEDLDSKDPFKHLVEVRICYECKARRFYRISESEKTYGRTPLVLRNFHGDIVPFVRGLPKRSSTMLFT